MMDTPLFFLSFSIRQMNSLVNSASNPQQQQQQQQHHHHHRGGGHTPNGPHTPHTPNHGGGGVASGGGPTRSQLPDDIRMNNNDTLAQLDLSSDLNFDPAAVIEGGGEGQEGLNVIPSAFLLKNSSIHPPHRAI